MQHRRRTRNDYAAKIFEYKKRREVFRERFGIRRGVKAPLEYHRAVRKINRKIRIWDRGMRKIGKRKCDNPEIMPRRLAYYINDFIHVDVRNIRKGRTPIEMQAKWLFSKYGLEHGIEGTRLSTYMDCHHDRAATLRMSFTRKFPSNPSLRDLYQAFCNYIQENEEENQQLNRVTEEHPSEG